MFNAIVKHHEDAANKPLKEHVVWAFWEEFRGFNWRKFWTDLFAGSVIALIPLIVGISQEMSLKTDWDEHPVLVILMAILPVSVLAADVLWRIWKASIGVYRARKNQEFREAIHGAVAIIGGAVIYFSITAYPIYLSYPHLILTIGAQGCYVGSVPHLFVRNAPPTYAICPDVSVINRGAEASISPKGWQMEIRTIGGITFAGDEDYIVPSGAQFGKNDFLFDKVSNVKLGRGAALQGVIGFLFIGVNGNSILEPGTRYTIKFRETNGTPHKYSTIMNKVF